MCFCLNGCYALIDSVIQMMLNETKTYLNLVSDIFYGCFQKQNEQLKTNEELWVKYDSNEKCAQYGTWVRVRNIGHGATVL